MKQSLTPTSSENPPVARRRRGARAYAEGHAAEGEVAARLEAEGWSVLARNLRTPAGEIDLIACRGDVLIFVEVKLRPTHYDAAFAFTLRQQRRLLRAAEAALALHPHWARTRMRFDVFLIDAKGGMVCIPDALRES